MFLPLICRYLCSLCVLHEGIKANSLGGDDAMCCLVILMILDYWTKGKWNEVYYMFSWSFSAGSGPSHSFSALVFRVLKSIYFTGSGLREFTKTLKYVLCYGWKMQNQWEMKENLSCWALLQLFFMFLAWSCYVSWPGRINISCSFIFKSLIKQPWRTYSFCSKSYVTLSPAKTSSSVLPVVMCIHRELSNGWIGAVDWLKKKILCDPSLPCKPASVCHYFARNLPPFQRVLCAFFF